MSVNGTNVIVCGGRTRQFCATCGRPASALCDWKVADRTSGTCDQPICQHHAKRVGLNKHLCPTHQRQYEFWKKKRLYNTAEQLSMFEEAS